MPVRETISGKEQTAIGLYLRWIAKRASRGKVLPQWAWQYLFLLAERINPISGDKTMSSLGENIEWALGKLQAAEDEISRLNGVNQTLAGQVTTLQSQVNALTPDSADQQAEVHLAQVRAAADAANAPSPARQPPAQGGTAAPVDASPVAQTVINVPVS